MVKREERGMSIEAGRVGGWFLSKLSRDPKVRPRLTLIERITLAPKQTLALIEAEGRHFLVAMSQESAPCLYPLDPEVKSLDLHHLERVRERRGI
jgi:hypothetical protein